MRAQQTIERFARPCNDFTRELALLLRRIGEGSVTDALARTDAVKPAVEAVWGIGTSLLVTVAVSAITFGILVVIAAWIAGPTRVATSLREAAAPYLRERRGTAYAVAGLVFRAHGNPEIEQRSIVDRLSQLAALKPTSGATDMRLTPLANAMRVPAGDQTIDGDTEDRVAGPADDRRELAPRRLT